MNVWDKEMGTIVVQMQFVQIQILVLYVLVKMGSEVMELFVQVIF